MEEGSPEPGSFSRSSSFVSASKLKSPTRKCFFGSRPCSWGKWGGSSSISILAGWVRGMGSFDEEAQREVLLIIPGAATQAWHFGYRIQHQVSLLGSTVLLMKWFVLHSMTAFEMFSLENRLFASFPKVIIGVAQMFVSFMFPLLFLCNLDKKKKNKNVSSGNMNTHAGTLTENPLKYKSNVV